jgi:hypothetical protein
MTLTVAHTIQSLKIGKNVDEVDDGTLALSRHLTGGTEKKHETPQSIQSVSGPKFECTTSRIREEADWLLKSDVGLSQR